MLVQKSGLSKRTKILLIIFCALILPGGYFVYSTYFAKPSSTTGTLNTAQPDIEQAVIVTPLNEGLLNDTQAGSFTGKKVDGFAEQQSGIYLDTAVPLPPEKITVTNPGTGGRLVVSWQLPAQKNFTTVKVYRSESSGAIGQEMYAADVTPASTLMNYSDAGLDNQKTYYYLVVTLNSAGQVSTNNQQYSGMPTDVFPPSAPLNVTVQNISDNQVKISWVIPQDPDFSTVRIYKSNQSGAVGAAIQADMQDGGGNSQYALDTVTPNMRYFYTVTSVDTSGNESSKDVMAAPYRANPFEPAS